MKLKETLKWYISHLFNRLEIKVRQSQMAMQPDLQHGYPNGQMLFLAPFSERCRYWLEGWENVWLKKMLKLSQMEGRSAVPSHRVSTRPVASSHGNNFCWIGYKTNRRLQGTLQALSFHDVGTKNTEHVSGLAGRGADSYLVKIFIRSTIILL